MSLVALIKSSLKEVKLDEVISIQPQTCRSFEHLMSVYKQDMTVTQSFEDCMAVCLAAHIAVTLEGDLLWMYLVGSPSSGKSTICELLGADEIHTCPMDTLTGIVSGDRKGRHLLPLMQGKCVIVKDGTLLLESSPQQLANVYGELRSAFDGTFTKHFRNGVSASFANISFGMIIGITERIYSLNMAALGERFLHCRLEISRDIEMDRNQRAVQNIFETTGKTNFEGNEVGDSRSFPKQRAYTAGFMSYLHSKVRENEVLRPGYTQHDVNLIQSLADVIACSRAQAPRVRGEYGSPSELLYDARPEASTRVVKQLSRLALCLCYTLGVNEITEHIRRLLTKVALDTAFSRQHTLIRCIALSKGLKRSTISTLTGLPIETVSRRCDDLISLGILLPDNSRKPERGPQVPVLHCAPWIAHAFRTVEQHASVPDSTDTQPRSRPIPTRRQTPPVQT